MTIVKRDGRRISVCSICEGPWTVAWAAGRKAFACMRCDTSVTGSGDGPPRFMAIWGERRKDLKIRGSEETES